MVGAAVVSGAVEDGAVEDVLVVDAAMDVVAVTDEVVSPGGADVTTAEVAAVSGALGAVSPPAPPPPHPTLTSNAATSMVRYSTVGHTSQSSVSPCRVSGASLR